MQKTHVTDAGEARDIFRVDLAREDVARSGVTLRTRERLLPAVVAKTYGVGQEDTV